MVYYGWVMGINIPENGKMEKNTVKGYTNFLLKMYMKVFIIRFFIFLKNILIYYRLLGLWKERR